MYSSAEVHGNKWMLWIAIMLYFVWENQNVVYIQYTSDVEIYVKNATHKTTLLIARKHIYYMDDNVS